MQVSVVIPSFNQARFLRRTLESVCGQDYEKKEIIVVDGGSADGSVDIIKEFEDKLTYWTSVRDSGQADAIANGFNRATGELVGWLNSDDVLVDGTLSKVVARARRFGTSDAVFYGGHKIIDEYDNVMDLFPEFADLPWVSRCLGPTICQPGTFFGQHAYARIGGLNRSLQYAMDRELWLRFQANGFPFVRVPGYLALFRRHSGQKGHTRAWLVHAREERMRLTKIYGLAAANSFEFAVAKQFRRIIGLLNGTRLVTLAYRLVKRRSLREYHPELS